MKLVLFKLYGAEGHVYVNPERVISLESAGSQGSYIYLGDNFTYYVEGNLERVNERLLEANNA